MIDSSNLFEFALIVFVGSAVISFIGFRLMFWWFIGRHYD